MHMLDNSAPAKYTNTRSHKKLQVMELYIINALLDKPSPQQSSARNAANHTHGHAEKEKLKKDALEQEAKQRVFKDYFKMLNNKGLNKFDERSSAWPVFACFVLKAIPLLFETY